MYRFGEDESQKSHYVSPRPITAASSVDLEEVVCASQQVSRRTQADVKRLTYRFKQFFESSLDARERLLYFWPDRDLQDRCLATLAHDIPREKDPLAPTAAGKHDPQKAPVSSRKKDNRSSRLESDCVLWLGFVNKRNGFAAIELKLPETYNPWITYTNRLIVYLFGNIAGCKTPQEFLEVSNVAANKPFPMKCGNSLCVRLSHINYELSTAREVDSNLSCTEQSLASRDDSHSD